MAVFAAFAESVGLRKLVGEAGGMQELVLFAQRHTERRSEAQHHLAARLGAAGLEEAQVSRRHIGRKRQLELTQPMAVAPVLEQRRKQARCFGSSHARILSRSPHDGASLKR